MKKNKFLALIVFILLVKLGAAQSFDAYTKIKTLNILANSSQGRANLVSLIASDDKDNLFITGFSNGLLDIDPSDNSNNIENFYLAKYNTSLELQWAILLPTGSRITDMKVLNNDELIITGNIQKQGFANWVNTENLFVRKYDKNGNLLWHRLLTSKDYPLSIYLDIAESGSIFLTGSFNDFITTDDGFTTRTPVGIHPNVPTRIISTSIYLLKLDKNGNTKSLKTVIKSLTRPLVVGPGGGEGAAAYNEIYHSSNIVKYKDGQLYFSFFPVAYSYNSDNSIDILQNASTNTYTKHQIEEGNMPYLMQIDSLGQFKKIFTLKSIGRNARHSPLLNTTQKGKIILNVPYLGLSMDSRSVAFDLSYDPDMPNNTAATESYLVGSSSPLGIAFYNNNLSFDKLFRIDKADHSVRSLNGISSNIKNDILISGDAGPGIGSTSFSIDLDPNPNNTFSPPSTNHTAFAAIYSEADELIWGKYYEKKQSITGSVNHMYTVQVEGDLIISVYEKPIVLSVLDQNNNQLMMYPNPVTNTIHITNIIGAYHYQIFNISGKLIQSEYDYEASSINVAPIHNGVYILRITEIGSKKRFVSKFLKK